MIAIYKCEISWCYSKNVVESNVIAYKYILRIVYYYYFFLKVASCRHVSTVNAPVFGTLNSAISNFQTWFVRTVMEVLKYWWMLETNNMQCNYNSFIQIINFHGFFHNALRRRKTGACRILVPLRYIQTFSAHMLIIIGLHTILTRLSCKTFTLKP